jgi:uncharacterized damage-inducible protein DinB
MSVSDLLSDAFDRIRELVSETVTGLSTEQLATQPAPGANSIGWLIWHLSRVQDDHVAGAAGTEQVWTAQGWDGRFGLPLDSADTGYGHGPDEVAAVRVPAPELLTGYYDAVADRTAEYISSLTEADLARVVDENWQPPVTLGVRLISVLSDDLQHAGQAAYVRGLLED